MLLAAGVFAFCRKPVQDLQCRHAQMRSERRERPGPQERGPHWAYANVRLPCRPGLKRSARECVPTPFLCCPLISLFRVLALSAGRTCGAAKIASAFRKFLTNTWRKHMFRIGPKSSTRDFRPPKKSKAR